MNKQLILAITFMVSVTGCFGNEPGGKSNDPVESPTVSSSATETKSPEPCAAGRLAPDCVVTNTTVIHYVEMLGCKIYLTRAVADSAKLAPHVPEGYEMDSAPAQLLFLDGYVCSSAVLDNATVVQDFHIFYVGLQLDVPSEVDSEGRDSYLFELCTNNEAVKGFLEQAGFRVCDGSVAVTVTGQLTNVVYTIDGAEAYDISGVMYEQDGSTFPGSSRDHQANVGTHAFYDWSGETATIGVGAGPALFSGGFIAGVLVAPAGAPTDFGINSGDCRLEIPSSPTVLE